MRFENAGHADFFSEMSDYQVTAREFFNTVLLDSLDRNFGFKKTLIWYFNTEGEFLSWTGPGGILFDCEEHPYRALLANDVVRQTLYKDAVRDHLTYFNVLPRLYKSTELIDPDRYAQSDYIRFLNEQFDAHYSVTLAFGINAYIQVSFFKSREEGDFSEEEIEALRNIYVYLANSYKNFKKYEQAKIIASIQSEIVSSGEKAYLITDDFMHIMSYNKPAQDCLTDILGPAIADQMSSTSPCGWLPFLLGNGEERRETDLVQTRVIRDYIFKIYTYDRCYSNGIVDRYHWITISKNDRGKVLDHTRRDLPLTQAEQRVAELMYNGLTYKAIADELVVSYHTVKKHVQNIYNKCGVNSRYELYKWLEHEER